METEKDLEEIEMSQRQRFNSEFYRQFSIRIDDANFAVDGVLARNFAWFCLGESSGMELAAQTCDENGMSDGVTCAEEIRNGCVGRKVHDQLKALHNPELMPAAAHMIVTQRDEIERLKGLLRDAADDISHWSSYAPEYFVEKYKADDDIQKYREAGEVTK